MTEVRIRNRKISVQDTGGEGPAVLWIHAFPLSGEIFRNQISLAGYRHVVPDLPGFGHSRDTEDFGTIDDTADALFELMTQLGILKFTVAGVSMGGYIALAMLRSSSADRLRGLILMDTRETADSDQARENRFRQIAAVESSGTGSLVDDMAAKLLGHTASRSIRDEVRNLMELASPSGVTAALRMMAERPDSTEALSTAEIPALLVFGEEDAITPLSEGERMAGLNTRFRLASIPEAGHLSCLESPELVNQQITRFLGAVHR